MDGITEAIRTAWQSYREIARKYPVTAGWADRSHGDNIRLGKRFSKLMREIEKAGLKADVVLFRLAGE